MSSYVFPDFYNINFIQLIYILFVSVGWHGGAVVALLPHSQEVQGPGISLWSFYVSTYSLKYAG